MSNGNSPYTPGPWTHIGQGDITGVETNGTNHGPVDVCCVYLRTVPGRTEANARLIAAAPDLLEALQRSLSWLSSYRGGGAMGCYDQARAAIAKALGESA